MSDDQGNRVRLINRADRLVRQSRTLRKMAEELLQESKDLRTSARPPARRPAARKKR